MTTPRDDWQYPYDTRQRYHLQHVHLFASDPDFPPVLLATSLGFAHARKLLRSHAPWIAAG